VIRLVIIGLPLVLGAYTVSLSPGAWTIILALLSAALCTAGAASRRYSFLVAGAGTAIVNFAAAMPSPYTPPIIWGALGTGIGAYLLLEAGYDWITAFRRPVGLRVYASRLKFLLLSVVSCAGLAFFAVTISYNFLLRLTGSIPFWAAVIGVPAVVGSVGILIMFWQKNRMSEGG
jgi:hypothetical protein